MPFPVIIITFQVLSSLKRRPLLVDSSLIVLQLNNIVPNEFLSNKHYFFLLVSLVITHHTQFELSKANFTFQQDNKRGANTNNNCIQKFFFVFK